MLHLVEMKIFYFILLGSEANPALSQADLGWAESGQVRRLGSQPYEGQEGIIIRPWPWPS